MNRALPFLLLLLALSAFSDVKAQCNLNPVIKPDNLILCPNSTDTISVTKEFDTYQWYKFNKAIPGATQRYLVVDANLDGGSLFKVVVTKNGCTDTSKKVLVDGYAFAGPVTVTNGTPSYFDVENQVSVFCKNEPVSLFFPDPYSVNVQWYNNGVSIPGANSQTFKVTENGSYTSTGAPEVCPNYEVCQCLPVNIAIDKFTPTITRNSDTLLAGKGKTYQWFVNGNEIPGATSFYYLPMKRGIYTVEVTDKLNCTATSKPYLFTSNKNLIVISPNPAYSFITVHFNVDNAAQVVVSDIYGNRRLQTTVSSNNQNIQVGTLATGTYVLRVLDKKGAVIATEKFMKK